MTPSPDLIRELRDSRPTAPAELRTRVREIAREDSAPTPFWSRLRLPVRRGALVALPAAAALALVSAGAIGLSRSDGTESAALDSPQAESQIPPTANADPNVFVPAQSDQGTAEALKALDAQRTSIGPTPDRAQRVSATLAVEVEDSDAVSRASQEALDLTRRLGGHVLSASVTTGDEPTAALTVRVPVDRVQEAVVQLSALGRIVSQKVTIDDLQGTIDRLDRRERSVRAQIAILVANLESDSLDATTRARLEARLANLRDELRSLRRGLTRTNAEARMATLQLAVVTPDAGAVAPPSRLSRALDEAVNVLVWEGVILLAILIVAAPFALVALVAWLGRRFYRRREEDRLLAT
jgi:nucleotide-binding universal stress UspA family protein